MQLIGLLLIMAKLVYYITFIVVMSRVTIQWCFEANEAVDILIDIGFPRNGLTFLFFASICSYLKFIEGK